MDWLLLIIAGVGAIALIIFLVVRNQKDEKELEDKIKNDYRKPTAEYIDIDSNEVTK